MVRKTKITKEHLLNTTKLEEKPEYAKILSDKPNVTFKIPNRKSLEYLRGHFNIVYLDDNRVRKMQQDFLLERFSKYYGFKVGEVKAALEANNMEVVPEAEQSEFASAFGSMAASPVVEPSGGDNPPPPPGGGGIFQRLTGTFTRIMRDPEAAAVLQSFMGRQPPPSPGAGGEQVQLYSPQRPPLNLFFGQRQPTYTALIFGEATPPRTLIGTTPLGSPETEQQILGARQQELNSALERAFYEEDRARITQQGYRSAGPMPAITEFVTSRPQVFDISDGDLPPVPSSSAASPARTETQFTTDETGQPIRQEVEAPTYVDKGPQNPKKYVDNIIAVINDPEKMPISRFSFKDKIVGAYDYVENLIQEIEFDIEGFVGDNDKEPTREPTREQGLMIGRLVESINKLKTVINENTSTPFKLFEANEYKQFHEHIFEILTDPTLQPIIIKVFKNPEELLNRLSFVKKINLGDIQVDIPQASKPQTSKASGKASAKPRAKTAGRASSSTGN